MGARVILDCYQSAGIVPLDVTRLGVDFAVGGSVKWLCGGPGNGWLYVRPELAEELQPTYVGWQAHARPFAFEEELEYATGTARFLTGTPNPVAHMAGTAVEMQAMQIAGAIDAIADFAARKVPPRLTNPQVLESPRLRADWLRRGN